MTAMSSILRPAPRSIVDIKNDKISELTAKLAEATQAATRFESLYKAAEIDKARLQEEYRLLVIENVKILNRKGSTPKFTVGKGKFDDFNNI